MGGACAPFFGSVGVVSVVLSFFNGWLFKYLFIYLFICVLYMCLSIYLFIDLFIDLLIYIFDLFFRGRLRNFFWVPGSLLSCFSCLFTSLLFRFSAFHIFCCLLFLRCFTCFSASLLGLLLLFSASLLCFRCFHCFSAFILLLLCLEDPR